MCETGRCDPAVWERDKCYSRLDKVLSIGALLAECVQQMKGSLGIPLSQSDNGRQREGVVEVVGIPRDCHEGSRLCARGAGRLQAGHGVCQPCDGVTILHRP